jgi:SAM-dependent methyltransferase
MSFYRDQYNPDLLERIPLDARVVLDVGCGTGALAAEYKRRNPVVRYLGIEPHADRAELAVRRCDRVAVVDAEVEPMPFGTEPVDCLIYGDVLEHMQDPWTLLRRQAELLTENGVVLICMPNVEHWSFAERLLRGTWDYEAEGLFDAGHLRWFTAETTRRALLAAGLVPCDVTPRAFQTAPAEAFARAIEPALVALGIEPQAWLRRALPLQYVWRARRRPPAPLRLVSTMLPPVGGVSHVRVLEPLRAMLTDPQVSASIVSDLTLEPVDEATPRIFILHRPLMSGPQSLEPIRRLLDAGYLVVCEFDDHPDYIPVAQGLDLLNFRAVHAIQTSTQALADVLARDNPEVAVFPNAISRLPEVRNFTNPDQVTLFFAALNREEEWPPLLPALNAVAAIAGARLNFQIVGDRGLFDALDTPHKSFTPLCDYETYQALLGASEISFMPLRDTPFNRCKSDLKFVEAAAHRVVALAPPVAYGDSIVDGHTGILYDDTQTFQQRLLRIVADPQTGRAIGDAARAYVAKHRMLAYQTARRIAWYRALWLRRDELNRALLARLPELASPP